MGLGDVVSDALALPREDITVLYNPVVAPSLALQAREEVDHPWFSLGEPPVILGVGTFKEQKDWPTLIRGFALVREDRPARLVILGDTLRPGKDDAIADEIRRLPAELGIAEDVDFPGFSLNPYAYMSRAGVLALSSG